MKSVNYSFSSCVCANFMLLWQLGVEQGGQPARQGALGGQSVAHSLQLDDELPLYLLLSRESQNKPLKEVFHTR